MLYSVKSVEANMNIIVSYSNKKIDDRIKIVRNIFNHNDAEYILVSSKIHQIHCNVKIFAMIDKQGPQKIMGQG